MPGFLPNNTRFLSLGCRSLMPVDISQPVDERTLTFFSVIKWDPFWNTNQTMKNHLPDHHVQVLYSSSRVFGIFKVDPTQKKLTNVITLPDGTMLQILTPRETSSQPKPLKIGFPQKERKDSLPSTIFVGGYDSFREFISTLLLILPHDLGDFFCKSWIHSLIPYYCWWKKSCTTMCCNVVWCHVVDCEMMWSQVTRLVARCHVMWCHFVSWGVMSCRMMWCGVMSRRLEWCGAMRRKAVSCHVWWSDVKWCGAMGWDEMLSGGYAMWLVVRSCSVMWCHVALMWRLGNDTRWAGVLINDWSCGWAL